MAAVWRIAGHDDLTFLVELMTEFYRESGYQLDGKRSMIAFETIVSDPSLGRVWVLDQDKRPVGYMVLTLGFSMEYGGRDAFLDDLFIRRDYRGAGLGKAALKTFFDTCRLLDVRAVHLEVGWANTAAKALYAKFGFRDNDRQLLTRRLSLRL